MKRLQQAAPAAPADSDADPSFAAVVVEWQKAHGRHSLPWQKTNDPYRVWLSEVMLQQTQVATVIPYYQRFLQRFPDVASLAAAPVEEVMALWAGLGYYTRARNLHQCAKAVVEKHGGAFPRDPEELAALPGIGRSTAAAIAAFSYGARAAILDGNVKRVFARVFGIDGYPGSKPVEDRMWRLASALLPEKGMEAYTQGLMDLGATICTRGSPVCLHCPLSERCVARKTGRIDELPVRKPAKAVPEKHTLMMVITDGDRVLLERRPPIGIWGGLLSLPERDVGRSEEDLLADAACYGQVKSSSVLPPFSHGFTHFKLHVSPLEFRLAKRGVRTAEAGHIWLDKGSLTEAALPAPVKKFLLAVLG